MSANEPRDPELREEKDGGGGEGRGGLFRGFSLIELMLVIAIISILTVIAFISMLHYGLVIRVNASARDLGGHMRLARAAAIRDGRSYQFVYSGGSWLYGTDADENGVPDGSVKTYSLQPGIQFGVQPDSPPVPGHPPNPTCGVYVGGACGSTVYLRRDGSLSADGVAYLIPSKDYIGTGARKDRQRAVDWSAGTGRVRVWHYKNTAGVWR